MCTRSVRQTLREANDHIRMSQADKDELPIATLKSIHCSSETQPICKPNKGCQSDTIHSRCSYMFMCTRSVSSTMKETTTYIGNDARRIAFQNSFAK